MVNQFIFENHPMFTYIGGEFVFWISSSFNLINSLSLGYSSNLSARPTYTQSNKYNITVLNTISFSNFLSNSLTGYNIYKLHMTDQSWFEPILNCTSSYFFHKLIFYISDLYIVCKIQLLMWEGGSCGGLVSHLNMVYVYVPAFWGTFSQNLV